MSEPSGADKTMLQRIWSVFDPNERYLKGIQPLVEAINALEPEFEGLSQQDLQDRLRQIRALVERAREATLAAQAELPPAEDSDTRRRREKEVVAAEKAVLDEHLPVVFAAVREAAKRTLSMRHFDVQLLGGIVLHEGRIAEMKTGEGKTLTATSPLVLNALAGRGAHLVTTNDYLARRDAEWMGKIYRYLGLTVGVIQHDLSREARQAAYGCDITYITNHEIGFDYLRDNSSAWRPEHLVIRELYFVIVDEVDSILIDEARVPLIISASRGKPVERYRKIQEVVQRLVKGEQDLETKETTGDFYIDEKAKNATITEDGQRKVEIALGIDNLNDSAHIEDMHLVSAALKANFCYKRDVDYIVGPGDGGVPSVIIVDSFTGRPQPGRRWSDGLHQAIEAKERVPIQDEQQTIATVTYQNFFLMYKRMSGMTGTAKTEEAEFVNIYEMPVVVVPTNRPLIRLGHPDVVYKSEEWKLRGITCEIAGYYCRRQPVLVGTRSVEMSELVSARLRPDQLRLALQFLLVQWHVMEHEKKLDKELVRRFRDEATAPLETLRPRDAVAWCQAFGLPTELTSTEAVSHLLTILELDDETALREVIAHGVPHEVLNARHHEREAQIVAQAGRLGAVTIATNMAGRGTDIVLGGNPEPDVEALLERRGIDPKSLEATLFMNQALKGDSAAAAAMAEEAGGLPAPLLREIETIRAAWRAEQTDVVATGGLHILGTERHESRRIDNQLRGRSGRQGDPGSSRFYISLQDELMRLFGPERWGLLMNQWPEEQPVEAKIISKAMNNAQKKVEGRNFDIRKNTLRYDDVMNVQRQHIYAERRRILDGVDLRGTVSHMMGDLVDEVLAVHVPLDSEPGEWDLPALWRELNQRFPLKDCLAREDLDNLGRDDLRDRLRSAAERAYDDKENDFIRSVVEFELQASIHETLAQVNHREGVCQVLNALWPLAEVLPARLAGVPDNKVPETLLLVAREALEAEPRAFITAVVADRLERQGAAAAQALAEGADPVRVLADLEADWPVKLDPTGDLAEQLTAALAREGWAFVTRAVQRQMNETVRQALPEHCDLPALVESLDLLWPLGEGLAAEQLAQFNYGVIDDKLRRLADQLAARHGAELLEAIAEHRLERLRAAASDADEAWLRERLAAVLPHHAPVDPELLAGDETALDDLFGRLRDGLVLRAVEEVAEQAVIEAHRHLSAGSEEEDEGEEVAYGDLNRLIEQLSREWAVAGVLDPWELERLPPGQVRAEMASQVRLAVRTRGLEFVTETAQLRLHATVERARSEHYSRPALCARLSQRLELAGVFEPERLADCETPAELTARLRDLAAEALEEEPERLHEFSRELPGLVQEGYNLKRFAERVSADLGLAEPLTPAELADLEEESLVETVVGLLADELPAYADRFVHDCVLRQLGLSLDQALDRFYDLRAVSEAIAAAWPIRPDAVRASKLKGWTYTELAKRLQDLLAEAYRWEEWRFTRRFVMRQLEAGLEEVLDEFCPAGTPAVRWDVAGACAELARRWPLTEPPEPGRLPTISRGLLVEALRNVARQAYGERERAFVRLTARHRSAQQLDALRRERYSLERAARAIDERWSLGGGIGVAQLAQLRRVEDDEDAFAATLTQLVEPVLERAEAAFFQDAIERRISESVEDVIRRHYNTTVLLRELLGRWPLAGGALNPNRLRALPFRELTETLRQTLLTADGSLRRRIVYHNLRETARELPLGEWLPSADPATWRLGELAVTLAERLPAAGAITPEAVAGRLLSAASASERVRAAAAGVTGEALAAVLRDRLAASVDAVLATERRPGSICARLAREWGVGERLDAGQLKGKSVRQVTEELKTTLIDLAADQPAFLAAAARRWLENTLDEALEAYWPADREPGPWVLAQITSRLNDRWRAAEHLHPSHFKGLERDQLREALLEAAAGLPEERRMAGLTAELVTGAIDALAVAAGAAAVAGGGFDPVAAAATLAAGWPGDGAPSAASLTERLTIDRVAETLLKLAETLEREVVGEFETEAIQTWLGGRIDAKLAAWCSLTAVGRELSRRWPVDELDTARLAGLNQSQVTEQLTLGLRQVAREGGEAFVLGAARRRLEADVADILARGESGEGQASLLARWPWTLTPGEVTPDRVRRAAAELTEAQLRRTFLLETVERRLRQAVVEAQTIHANPEIARERWDVPAFVAALERDWPIAGRLVAAELAELPADRVRETAQQVLREALAADEDGFIAASARQQLGRGLREALAEHASLERLAKALADRWPRPSEFSAAGLAEGRWAELIDEVTARLRATGRREPDLREEVDRRLAEAPGDLDELTAWLTRQWPELAGLTAVELDETLVGEHLQTRLWEEFDENPRAFVKAVALEDVPRQLERRLMLEAIDTNWCNHLEAMDYLREGINLRGYAQTDPFIAYRKEGRTMFENMLGRVRETVVAGLFETTDHQIVDMHARGRLGLRIAVEYQNVQEQAAKAEELTASHTGRAPARAAVAAGGVGARRAPTAPEPGGRAPVVVEKVGRNDPCPCGSGKKYKHCCGRGG